MPATSTEQLVRSQLDAAARRDARFLDLQIDWVRYKSGTPIARYGGLWDRTTKAFAGDAPRSRVIEVHAAQVEAIQAFDAWMGEHLDERDPELLARVREIIQQDLAFDAELGTLLGLSELYLTGGRRSGKSVIMEGILSSYAVAVPGSIVWTVTPAETYHEEPRAIVAELLPKAWYEYNGWPHFTFYLANGSQHVLRSGHKPGALKKGKASLVGVNEAQQISAESYRNARGATIDAGGFTLVAANPPTLGDVGVWVLDAVGKIETGDRPAAEHFFCDPLDNPHIDIRKLLALRSGMTLHDWETQIRGKMLQLPDRVLYTWNRAVNERAAPDFGKITHEFITAHEGDRARWKHLIAVDVQKYPWVAVGIFEVFRDPRAPTDPKHGLLWLVDEIALTAGDEVDVCTELKRRGYDGERCLVITDASCEWQQLERDLIKQRPNYKGKGSNHIFRSNGFPHVVPPDRASKGNPDVFERIRATNATIRPADDVPGLFISPKCPNAVDSAKKWRMIKGKPSRRQDAAHFGDVIGYCVWRFFPRRGDAGKLLSEGLERERTEGFRELGGAGGDPLGGFAPGRATPTV
jgi:hypothetical protein